MDQSTDKGGPGNSSTRPYLIRALHDWCTDNGFTPYIAVHVDRLVQVPMEYVSNNEIVLNVGFDATSGLDLGNEFIQFKARFGGTAREIIVPVDHVVAIYARENGQGMAFPAPEVADAAVPPAAAAAAAAPAAADAPKPVRGLRLASVPSPASASADESPASESAPQSPAVVPVVAPEPLAAAPALSSVPASPAPAADAAPDDGSEPDGPGPGAGRPALKRVK